MKKLFVCVCLFLCGSFLFAFSPAKTESAGLTVIMYHSVTSAGKSRYIVTEKQLEDDLAYLTKKGYTTVSAKQLCDYVDGSEELPKKPVLLTFDDGHYNNLSAALPLLEKYACKAVVSVIGKFSEYASDHPSESHHPEYSYLTWDDIKKLNESGRVEIGSHTYNMHNYSPRFGIGRLRGENDETYVEQLTADANKLNDKLAEIGVRPIVFAYPFGRYNTLAQNTLLGMGFRITLSCSEGINIIEKGNPKSLIHLKRYNRDSTLSTEKFFTSSGLL